MHDPQNLGLALPLSTKAGTRTGLGSSMKWKLLTLLFVVFVIVGVGVFSQSWLRHPPVTAAKGSLNGVVAIEAASIALVSQTGDELIDREIRTLQEQARSKQGHPEAMKRLGWAFVRKARLSYDPGYYKLAEQCALAVESRHADDPDALLLQGHILQSLHKFKEAEPIVRKLIKFRGESADQGLLGDVLMEQGKAGEAIIAYQNMVNLRPDLQSYTRIAHLRWLKGDLVGAIEVIELAVTGASPREPEPGAWAYTRMGIYSLQAGQLEVAKRSAALALTFADNYPPALLLRGRVLLAQGRSSEVLESLRQAATLNPLPEYQWILADALRDASQSAEAEEVERKLISTGAANDPRTFTLFLATRGQQPQQSLQLAFDELKTREDVFTMDALAWALRANGRLIEALDYSRKSLTEGTQDARLFYHAGCIAMANGLNAEARMFFSHADEIKQMLFPSERTDLNKQFVALKEIETPRPMAQQ
jgi:tetratricopeptide (TPR) repeat protein